MGKIVNWPLIRCNKETVESFFHEANDVNAEIFFAIGVGVNDKDLHLFYNHSGGIDRIIETMRHALNALEVANTKIKKRG